MFCSLGDGTFLALSLTMPSPSAGLFFVRVLWFQIYSNRGVYFLFRLTVTFAVHKKLSLGTQPMTLTPFVHGGSRRVFAVSDRSTVIYCASGKLLFSSVNNTAVGFP